MANGDQEKKKKANPIDAIMGGTPATGGQMGRVSFGYEVSSGSMGEVPDDPLHRFYAENFPEYVHEGQDFGASPVPRGSHVNIIDYMVQNAPDVTWSQRPKDLTPFEHFTKATKESALYPFQIFMGEDEASKELIADPTKADRIASVLGNFVGMGIGYIPFGLGTSLLLKGVGLTARVGSPLLYRVIHGATSFGAFEAGGSEELKDVPKHFLFGAALGAGGEVVLGAWAARNRRGLTVPPGKIAHPDALAIEQQLRLHEGKSPEEIMQTLRAIGSEDDQLAYVAAQVAQVHRPYGSAIIPGIRDPERVIAHLKTAIPDAEFAVHRPRLGKVGGATQFDEYAEILIANTTEELTGLSLVRGEALQKVARMGGTGERVLSFEDGVRLIGETEVPGEVIPTPKLQSVDYDSLQKLWVAAGGSPGQRVLGFASSPVNELAVAATKQGKKVAKRFETLVHEYTHLFTGVEYASGTRRSLQRIDQIFDIPKIEPMVKRATVAGEKSTVLTKMEDVPEGLYKELRDSTLEVVHKFTGMTEQQTWDYVAKNWDYYGTDTELMSRLVELMATDPTLARQWAPRMSRIMAKKISRESPKLKWLLSRADLKLVDEMLGYRWKQSADEGLTFWRQDYTRLGKKQLRQFQVEGGYPGMGVYVEGRPMRWGGIRDVPEGHVRLIDPRTGKRVVKPLTDIQRPLFPQVVDRQAQILTKIHGLLEKQPPWVGFVFKNQEGFLQKGLVDLTQLEQIPNLQEYWKANKDEIISYFRSVSNEVASGRGVQSGETFLPFSATGELPRNLRRGKLQDRITEYVTKHLNKPGIAINDNGVLTIRMDTFHGPKAIRLGDVYSANFGLVEDKWTRELTSALGNEAAEAGMLGGGDSAYREAFTRIVPSFRNAMESVLLEAGVLPRELQHYMGYMEEALGENLMKLLDKPISDITEEARKKVSDYILEFGDDVSALASRSDFKVSRDINGDLRVVTQDNQIVGTFTNEAEARAFMARTDGPAKIGLDLDAEAQIPTSALGTGYVPEPKVLPQETMPARLPESRGIHRFFDSLNLFGSAFTALENVAKSIEKLGFGPAFTRVFDPAQKAIVEVDNLLAKVPRAELGGITYEAQLKKIEQLAVPLAKDRQEAVVQWVEYLSREEVARPGGYLVRGMNEEEIKLANELIATGMEHDVPRLLSLNRMMSSFLDNREKFINRVFPRAIRDRNLSPEKKELLERLRGVAGEASTKEELMEELGLTAQERWVIEMIDSNKGKSKDVFSLTAVTRYASAKPLEKGYKTGREMFAAQHGMNAHELQLGSELDKLFTAAFKDSGLSAKRAIGGYWPHLRQFSMWGIGPDDAFFKKEVPEFVEWVSLRYRTGELDVYNLDPVMTGFKHVRNMLMKEAFDPILPDLKLAVADLKAADPRAGKIMEEYVFELLGRPHASFDKMNQWIKSSANALGFEVSDDFAQKIVNNLTSLAYGASIPFRPALIARNYFQMAQMIPGRVGPEAFFKGMSRALTQEGFEEAVNAGAVEIHRLPLFASTEVFGIGAHRLQTIYPGLNKAGYRWRSAFDRGFNWYRKADDLGRAVAYHAQKYRVNQYADDLFKGKISYEEFKTKAKIKTFDEVDEAKFDELWQAGHQQEAIQELGRTLARETHFRYGHANHPAGWGSVYGRLFGQFGTFPVQYKDYLVQGLRRGTTTDKAEFLATHLAVNASIVAAGAAAGVNLWSWVVMPSLNYTGGPYADMAVNLYQSIGGSPTERSLAVRNLKLILPTWEDPQSIFVPGSYLAGDIAEAFQQNDGWEGLLTATGLRVMKPFEPNPMEQFYDWIPGID